MSRQVGAPVRELAPILAFGIAVGSAGQPSLQDATNVASLGTTYEVLWVVLPAAERVGDLCEQRFGAVYPWA